MVLLDEFIRSDNGFTKQAFTGLEVIRIKVGQRLKNCHGNRDFTDAADVLSEIGTVFGVPGMVGSERSRKATP